MKINAITFEELQHPAYILDETKLRSNLSLIAKIAKEADIEIILAFKAYALWKTFPIFREYINATTASSLNEAKLGYYEFGAPTHTFSPAYTDYEINEIAKCSSHLVFNSFSQFNNFHLKAKQANNKISIGLRINPEYSEVETLLYNPCALARVLVFLLINFLHNCLPISKAFIFIAIAKMEAMFSNAHCSTSKRN